MPNWCSNTLLISGPQEELRRFISAARGREHSYNDFYIEPWEAFDEIRLASILSTPPEDSEREVVLSFHRLYPVPSDVRSWPYDRGITAEVAKATGLKPPDLSGYEWENKYWGVKWGACDAQLNDHGNEVEYLFDTAWGPPIEWLNHVAEQWPGLSFSFRYEESGMGFCGDALWEGGVCIEHNQDCMHPDEEEDEDNE